MSVTISLSIVPGVPLTIPSRDSTNIQAILICNKSPYDLQVGPLGNQAARWLGGGMMDLWLVGLTNQFPLSILPSSNVNIIPTYATVVLLTFFYQGEKLPPGTYPAPVTITEVENRSLTIGFTGKASLGYTVTIGAGSGTQRVYLTAFDFTSPLEASPGTVILTIVGAPISLTFELSASSTGPVILTRSYGSTLPTNGATALVGTVTGTSAVTSSLNLYYFII